MQPSSVAGADGTSVGVILKGWTGGKGMIAAIISGLIAGWIYSIFLRKNITIKMPAGVPEGVVNAFSALIPGAVINSGMALTVANGGYIVTKQFLDQFMTVTGSGVTIGLVLFVAFWAKSKQLKQIGKLGPVPSFFNVNEPVLFGTPIVLNPLLAVPFLLMPMISGVIQYFAIYTGLCPLYGGVIVPWTCPPVISGFFVGGWRTALLQTLILVLSFFVYLPFIRMVDRNYDKQEKEAAAAEQVSEPA